MADLGGRKSINTDKGSNSLRLALTEHLYLVSITAEFYEVSSEAFFSA